MPTGLLGDEEKEKRRLLDLLLGLGSEGGNLKTVPLDGVIGLFLRLVELDEYCCRYSSKSSSAFSLKSSSFVLLRVLCFPDRGLFMYDSVVEAEVEEAPGLFKGM